MNTKSTKSTRSKEGSAGPAIWKTALPVSWSSCPSWSSWWRRRRR